MAAAFPQSAGVRDDKPVVMDKVVVKETKTHTLFMGADIAVTVGKDLYPVRGVVGSSWVIDVNGEERFVPTKQAALSLRITPDLKMTDVAATIVGYKKERAYSFDDDPSVRLTRGLDQAASTNADLLAIANESQNIADTVGNRALGPAAIFAESDNYLGATAMLNVARFNYSDLHSDPANPTGQGLTAPSTLTGFGTGVARVIDQQSAAAAADQAENGNEPGGRLAKTGLDAIDVEFDISSERPLQKPYVVTMARFRLKNGEPGMVQNLVYAKELHPVDKHPANVHFVEGGFPYDFELIDFQLHIYNRGEEVATTVSSKRVELTRDEAFEYIKMLYVGAHKDDTLPAVPAMGKLPADLPRRLAEGEYQETFFVKVSRDGLANGAFVDAACSRAIEDPYLEAIVRSLRFKPALAHGRPAEGVVELNLGKLKI